MSASVELQLKSNLGENVFYYNLSENTLEKKINNIIELILCGY